MLDNVGEYEGSIVKYCTKYEDLFVGNYVIFTGNNKETNKYIYEVTEKYVDAEEGIKLKIRKLLLNGRGSTWDIEADPYTNFFYVIHVEKLSKIKLAETVGLADGWRYEELTCGSEVVSSKPYEATNKMEKITMKNVKDQAVRANVDAAKTASLIAAGGVINQTVLTKLRPQLPMLMRGYADHPLADVILANIANFAVANFTEDNDKAVLATEAMMLAAMTKLTTSFNFEAILTDILVDVKLPDMKSENDKPLA